MDNPIYELLRSDGSIVVNKKLIFGIGHNEATVYAELLSRYYYFKEKKQLQPDGSFFNTIIDLTLGTGIYERAQRTSITKLQKLNLIKVIKKGIPQKRYFFINTDPKLIEKYLIEGTEKMEELRAKTINTAYTAVAENEPCDGYSFNTAMGVGNNTKVNNTKEIILKLKGIFLRRNTTLSLTDFETVLKHYFYIYNQVVGEYHPILNDECCEKLTDKLFNAKGDDGTDYELEADALIDMIDNHFETSYRDTDWNIMHFISQGVMVRRMFEVAY